MAVLGLALGLSLTGYLIVAQDLTALGAALAALGWGVALLPFTYLPHVLIAAQCLRLIFPSGAVPGYWRSLWGTVVARAVNILLPVASLGGDVVRARIIAQGGIPGAVAGAGATVDKTVQTVSLVLWGMIGIATLLWLEADPEIVRAAAVFTVGLAAAAICFVLVQRSGALMLVSRYLARHGAVAVAEFAAHADTALQESYRRGGRFLFATVLMTLARATLTLEVWLAAHLIGLPVGLAEALMLKSLTGMVRGVAFVVPSGLGVQEGAFILLGGLLGQPAEAMLAVALAIRGREILVSLPTLVCWQLMESCLVLHRVGQPRPADAPRHEANPATRPDA